LDVVTNVRAAGAFGTSLKKKAGGGYFGAAASSAWRDPFTSKTTGAMLPFFCVVFVAYVMVA